MRKMKKGEAARRRASTTSRGRSRKEPCKWSPVVFVFCIFRFLREKEREVWRVRWAAEEEEEKKRKRKEQRREKEKRGFKTSHHLSALARHQPRSSCSSSRCSSHRQTSSAAPVLANGHADVGVLEPVAVRNARGRVLKLGLSFVFCFLKRRRLRN